MASITLSETLIGREVERIFSEASAQYGNVFDNPVTGVVVDDLATMKPQKEHAFRALLAREYFALNGPADAHPLPIHYDERRNRKWADGLLDFFVAQYARAMEPEYDLEQRPAFSDYVSGVLWEHENNVRGARLPHGPDKIAELKKRFPRKKLEEMHAYCRRLPKKPKRKRWAA